MDSHQVKRSTHFFSNRNFVFYWFGNTISYLGDKIYSIGLAMLVLHLTGSALSLGMVFVFSSIPMLLFTLVGGVLADRYNKQKIMQNTDLLRAALLVIIALLVFFHQAQVWHIYILSILFGIFDAFFIPAGEAMLTDVVAPEQFVQANSFMQFSTQLIRILGPLTGGVLMLFGNYWAPFFLNGLSFLFSYWAIRSIRFLAQKAESEQPQVAATSETKTPYFQQLKEGFQYIVSVRFLLVATFSVMFFNLGMYGPMVVGLPVLATDVFKTGALGLSQLEMAYAIGAVVATFFAPTLSKKLRPRGLFLFVIMAVFGGVIFALGKSEIQWQAMIFVTIIGMLLTLFNVFVRSLMQAATKQEMMGRVMSYRILIGAGLDPVTFGLTGLLASRFGMLSVFQFGGLLIIAVGLIALMFKGARTQDA